MLVTGGQAASGGDEGVKVLVQLLYVALMAQAQLLQVLGKLLLQLEKG
jgi:hypothetical protein